MKFTPKENMLCVCLGNKLVMLAWFTFVLCCLNGEWPFNNLYNMQPNENLKNHVRIIFILIVFFEIFFFLSFYNLYLTNQQNCRRQCPYWAPGQIDWLLIRIISCWLFIFNWFSFHDWIWIFTIYWWWFFYDWLVMINI